MAKIQKVDYEKIPKNAQQMRAHGKELNTELTNAYQSVKDMHKDWYGKRYNALVKQFNKLTSQINDMLKIVVTDVPYALETIANNYSQADQGKNATSAKQESIKKITNIEESTDVGMRFVSSSVTSTQSKISKNFKSATEKMNTIEGEFKKISWESEAATAFQSKFNKLKKEIVTSFNDIEKSFTKLMNETKDDIEKAEKSNTVN